MEKEVSHPRWAEGRGMGPEWPPKQSSMFAALLTIAKVWKSPKCLPMDEE